MRVTIAASAQMRTPEPDTGGIGNVAYDMGRMLLARGHEVTLVAAKGSSLPGATVVEACEPVLGAVEKTETAVCTAALDSAYDVLLDITHTHKAAYTVPHRSVIYHQDVTPIARHPRPVFISNDQRSRTYKGHHGATVIINHMIPPDLASNPLLTAPVERDPDLAIFLGNIVPHKGAHLAIEVARRAGLRLWVAGRCFDGRYADRVLSRCDGERIAYVGPLNRNEKYRCLQRASMVICAPNVGFTDYHETGQLVVLESAFCGTPVLATRNGGISDYVLPEVGRCGTTLRAMLSAVPVVRAMDHNRIRAFAHEHFDLMRVAPVWEAILASQASD
jgi:glycosyltransferase involved in cell wall biosynthesis